MTFEKILSFFNSTSGWIIIGIIVAIGTGIYFRITNEDYNNEQYTPEQLTYPPVDYSIDKNRLTCILNRTPEELQKFCENAFPVQ